MSYEMINSDCLKAMQEMPDGCVDAIVTDPPYGLAFMGAKWDTFGRSKQYGNDSMEVRREKSIDYAEAHKGAPRYGNGHGPGKLTAEEALSFQREMTPIFTEAMRVAKPGAHLLCFGGTRTFHRITCAIEDAGWEIRDCIMWVYGSGFPKSMDVSKAIDKALGAEREKVRATGGLTNNRNLNDDGWSKIGQSNPIMDGPTPVTAAAAEWDGWGTCLKPAWEPIIVARKPLDGTVAHNVMTHGTGAINIDGCRLETFSDGPYTTPRSNFGGRRNSMAGPMDRTGYDGGKGRFPANLMHDGSQEATGGLPDGAERYFYCAKASKRDRGEGNDHPTVKPNALMRWLVRLVCPQGGTVLDPFMGSGSTGVACIQEGMRFVGIDMDEHYCEIAKKRISAADAAEGRTELPKYSYPDEIVTSAMIARWCKYGAEYELPRNESEPRSALDADTSDECLLYEPMRQRMRELGIEVE